MNAPLFRTKTIAAAYAALGGDETYSFTLSCNPTNSGNVTAKGPDGEEAEMVPGEYHYFRAVKLSDISVKGSAGDTVTMIGGTW